MKRVQCCSSAKRNSLYLAVLLCLSTALVLFSLGVSPVSASEQFQEPPAAAGGPTPSAPPAPRRQVYTVQDPTAYIHTVRPGESWIAISQQYGLDYPALREANPELWNLRYTVIRPGDQMVIPTLDVGEMPSALAYTVQYRDSWYKIAEHFGITYWDLRLDNVQLWHKRGIYIRPGDVLTVVGATQNFESAQPRLDVVTVEEAGEETATETASTDATDTTESADADAAESETPATEEQPAESSGNALPSSGASGPYMVGELPAGATLYVVRPGDTWFALASANGISFTDLRVANAGLWAARGQAIRVGDQMIIPAGAGEPIPPEIRTVPEGGAETPAAEETPAEGESPAEGEAPAEGETPAEGTADDATAPVETPTEEDVAAQDNVAAEGEATPEPAPEAAPDEERVGPMQPEAPDTTRLRIEVPPPTILYIVQTGEDWGAVAVRAGVSVEALQAANPALVGRELQPGDAVRFP